MKGGKTMISKKILLPVIAAAFAGVTVLGVPNVNAQTTSAPFANMVDAISQKFGLDRTKVQAVVEEVHKKNQVERTAMMKQKMETKLTQDVKDGKITEAQKQAIIKKLAEVHASVVPGSMKDKTPEQRKQEMEAKRSEMSNWAKSQGIDPDYLLKIFGRSGMHKQGWAKP